jgi:hypothetical protein
MFDDIADEGYTFTIDQIINQIDGINRLKKFIISNGDEPFSLNHSYIEHQPVYSELKIELNNFLYILEQRCKDAAGMSETPPF